MFNLSPFSGKPLRLRAEDREDLQVISAAVQDAVALVEDLAFNARARRFTLAINRFRWEQAGSRAPHQRVRSALSFDGVLATRYRGVRRAPKSAAIVLLAVDFTPVAALPEAEDPAGMVRLTLAGEGEIRLDVECLDATLADISRPWPARAKPRHDGKGA